MMPPLMRSRSLRLCAGFAFSESGTKNRALTPDQRQRCSDIVNTDGWDSTGVMDMPISGKRGSLTGAAGCPLFCSRSIDPSAPIKPDTRYAVFFFVISLFIFMVLVCGVVRFCARAAPRLGRVLYEFLVYSYLFVLIFASGFVRHSFRVVRWLKNTFDGFLRFVQVVKDLFAEPLEIELLQEGLRRQGRWLIDVVGDGNCLFRSMSFHVNGGNQHGYEKIRAIAIAQLRGHSELYMPFFAGGASNYKNYVEDMSADRVFGTGLEIGAMTNALGRPVRVWQTNMNTGAVISHFYEVDGAKAANNNPIEIAFLAEDQHYMAVEEEEEGGKEEDEERGRGKREGRGGKGRRRGGGRGEEE
eukprot:jgi/Undpi1/13346/HiC_scaffold_8.g03005.m1